MGSLKRTSTTRCRYAACFALGFVVASLLLAVMFWIIWCYMGLTIVPISDTQRRALVNYSYTTPKPPTTQSPVNRTEALESSLNAISKSPVTPPTQPRRSSDLAKGDFESRTPGGASQNSTRRESVTNSETSSHERKASILHRGEEDGLHPRKVSTSNTENRAQEEKVPEIKPTQVYAPAQSDPLPIAPKEEGRPIVRDLDRKDDAKSSRPSYRDPEFEPDLPPRRSDTGRRRYEDDDDYYDRGSPSRYDKRDRGRDTDDRYSKGDTRVYPDDRPRLDDRYPPRDSDRRRGDEDRYRDRDDRDREDRYRDRDVRDREDRYKDRDVRDREDRYKDRIDRDRDDRYRDREDRPRDYDERYRDRDRPYLDDDRNRRKDDRYDDGYLPRDDRYLPRYPADDDRSRERPYDDRRDKVVTRDGEDRYREPIMSSRPDISLDRKSDRRDDTRRPSDYDAPIRDKPRTSYSDESRAIDRYPNRDDEYVRPSRYDDRDIISPTRTKEEAYTSRSTVPLSRSRDAAYDSGSSIIDGRKRDDDRYRDRPRKYDDDNRRIDESRYISPSSVREADSTRRVPEVNRDDYRTRLPDDRRLDDVSLERRSYSAEEEEEYRRQNSRTRYYDDTDRKLSDDTRPDYRTVDDYPRRRPVDDEYPRRRPDDDEYRRSRPRGDYDSDVPRGSDRYDDDVRPSRRYLPEYDEPRKRTDADIGLRKESYPRDVTDDDRSLLRRPEGRLPAKDRRYDEDIPPRRSIYDDTIDDRPLRRTIDRASEDGRRRYKDDLPSIPDDSPRRIPPRSESKESFVGSSARDVVVREKRYPSPGRHLEDSGKEERPINTKDVIEAALKRPDAPVQNPREVFYPNFDPRLSNLTATDYIPLSDRRGTTITSRNRRRRRSYY